MDSQASHGMCPKCAAALHRLHLDKPHDEEIGSTVKIRPEFGLKKIRPALGESAAIAGKSLVATLY